MSSVQTFIQRCLLNLENANANPAVNVSPSAIDSDWWEWMKRYRVWQANREIFLYPENWMVPELRLDKSDLFQTLEGDLLQGDVTSDLVNSALLKYLQDLDVRARLDIVATYLDQNLTDASLSTLHVLGRTYAQPHKYFYRTYASGAWSAWESVTTSIEGDHIALAIWRGRLNLFWVTFVPQPQPPQSSGGGSSGSTGVGGLSFGQLTGDMFTTKAQQQYQLQLHWVDYFKGKWSNPIVSNLSHSTPIAVADAFVPSRVHIRVSKETVDGGSEGAINIHLDFPLDQTVDPAYWLAFDYWIFGVLFGISGPMPVPNYLFRVTSKNCDPVVTASFYDYGPTNPYNTSGIDATELTGSGSLATSFQSNITFGGSTTDTEPILQSVNNFELLACSNPVVPSPQFLNPNEALYQEAGTLISPFFFKDTTDPANSKELTFFVQPSLTEATVVEWIRWAIPYPSPAENWNDPSIIDKIHIAPQVPIAGPVPVNPGDPTYSIYSVQTVSDWVTSPVTAVSFGNALIGKNGGINLHAAAAPTVMRGGISTAGLARGRVTPGDIASTGVGVAVAGASQDLSAAPLPATGVFTAVGKEGLSLTKLRSIQAAQSGSPMASIAAKLNQAKS